MHFLLKFIYHAYHTEMVILYIFISQGQQEWI